MLKFSRQLQSTEKGMPTQKLGKNYAPYKATLRSTIKQASLDMTAAGTFLALKAPEAFRTAPLL